MSILKEVVGVIGSIILVYFGVRVAFTIIDFGRHVYRALAVKGHKGRIIPQLSFWAELEKAVKNCGDSAELPFEGALTIDVAKVSPEDLNLLSKIKNPVAAIARQIGVLIVCNNLAGKLEVRRDKNLLHICPVSL